MKFNILDLLLPRETKFYALLTKQAENLVEAAKEFSAMIQTLASGDQVAVMRQQAKIKELEKVGDKIERTIIDELDKTFITPLDREDIHQIATCADRSVDLINNLARKLEMYNVRAVPAPVATFCDIIVGITHEQLNLMNALPSRKGISEIIRVIHELEKRADDVYAQAIAGMFAADTDPVTIIKLKAVYEALEEITNSVDSVGKLIRGIMVKLG